MQHFVVPSLLSCISCAVGQHDCFRTPGCQITFEKTMPLVIRPKKRKKKKRLFFFKEQQFRLHATNQHLVLLQCTLLQGNVRQVPYLKAAVYRNCSSGGGRGDGALAPRASLNGLHRCPLLGRPRTAALRDSGFSALPAAALEMGDAGPGCLFPRISRSRVPFARSEKPADLLQLSFHRFIFRTAHVPTVAHT